MAINTRVKGTYTELYSTLNGGGNVARYITENKATMFPSFFTARLFQNASDVNLADWKEVTAAQRTQLEDRAKAWVRPPQLHIDRWNRACLSWDGRERYGCYNEETGYFELNGISDITYEESLTIWRESYLMPVQEYRLTVRTTLPLGRRAGNACDCYQKFRDCEKLESIRFFTHNDEVFNVIGSGSLMFWYCPKLHTIYNALYVGQSNNTLQDSFRYCASLVNVRIYQARTNVGLYDSPLISRESLLCLVTNALAAITVTVHADTFAKLSGDTTNAAAAALTAEELAAWQALAAVAAEKNITFATN